MLGSQLSASPQRTHAIDAIAALVLAEGVAAHRHPLSEAMTKGPEAARNIADAVHHLCLLHGRYPGVIDHAVVRSSGTDAQSFLTVLADSFEAERSLLTRLVVAVGPLPSTPGQAHTEATVLAQHHAIEMLAQSDRAGCALGAALAVAIDWTAIRAMLEKAAERLSLTASPSIMPTSMAVTNAVKEWAVAPAMERAMMFGAQQVVAQHRGLWDLLEARCIARGTA